MRIKQLEIQGFKSFVDHVVFRFGDGVTAIVGPNGCGKSNVLDAVKWVLGEQSPRNLRGQGMLDVIFNGSARRAPVGLAEVTLTLSNAHGPFAGAYAPLSEIQVTRVLHRSGESEYRINGLLCRLRDVQDLFMDTGAGTRAYSIVEQGRVDAIVAARPEERRKLLEEAAGITRYKARRDEALKQLERTQQNLDRVNDLLRELRRQLASLERQADKARRYQALRTRTRLGDLVVALLKWGQLSSRRAEVRSRHQALTGQLGDLEKALEATRNDLEQARSRLGDRGRRMGRLKENLSRTEAAIQVHKNTLRLQGDRIRSIEQRKTELEEARGRTDTRGRDIGHRLQQADQERAGLEADLETLSTRLTDLEAGQQRLAKARAEVASQLEGGKRAIVGHLTAVARLRNHIANLERRDKDLGQRIARTEQELVALGEDLDRLKTGRAELARTLEARRRDRDEARTALDRLEAERKQVASSIRERDDTLNRSSDLLAAKRSRLQSLRELQRNLEGYGEGVRALLRDYRSAGVLGTVVDLLDVRSEQVTAVESLLGHRLESVVVTTLEEARNALAFVDAVGAGRVRLVPRDAPVPDSPPIPEAAGVLGLLAGLADEGSDPLARVLLGDAVLVASVDDAIRLHRDGCPCTFVTPDGCVLEPGGALSGGGGREQGGLLQKKEETRSLETEISSLEAQRKAQAAALREARDQAARIATERDTWRERSHRLDLEVAAAEKDIQQTDNDIARARNQVRMRTFDLRSLKTQLEEITRERAAARGRLEAEEGARQSREGELEALDARVQETASELEAVREQVTRTKLEISGTRARRDEAARTWKRLEAERDELRKSVEALTRRRQAIEVEAQRATEAREHAAGQLEALTREAENTRAAISRIEAEYGEARLAMAQLESRLESARSRHDELRKAADKAALEISELELQLEHVRSGIEERFEGSITPLWSVFGQAPSDIEKAAAEADPASVVTLTDPDSGETLVLEAGVVAALRHELTPKSGESAGDLIRRWERETTDARRQLNRIGEVNLAAVEEYRTLEERTAFTEEQQEDLKQSVASIKAAINRINRTSRTRFRRTFDAINANFEKIFSKLFDGGSARLVLTDESDILETGVDIIVQPPGKRLQNMNLLSGGEKAMAAIGLIFALFLVRPSPFCILDEVDAPLDDVNSGRFHEVIRELARMSQFIVITHNKQTMEMADTLYGVTMEEPGVSRLVAVELQGHD